MDVDRRNLLIAAGVAASAGMASSGAGAAVAQTRPPEAGLPADRRIHVADWPEPAFTLDLWPDGVAPGLLNPALEEITVEEGTDGAFHYRAVRGISCPRLLAFPAANPNGSAVMIMPGGGYRRIAFDIEGYELARFLNAHGISAFVLLYRLPAEGWAKAADAPLADAQRAMRLIRSRAAEFGLDAKRLAAMGFSAGGHVCASLATRYDAAVYDPVDHADKLEARPMLAAPIYPVMSMDPAIAHMGSRDNLLGTSPDATQLQTYSPDRMVTGDTPPCFLTHAEDDGAVPIANSLVFRAALKAAGVPVETHLFPEGGHGFGLRKAAGKPVAAWGDLFVAFARRQGLFT